MNINLDHSSQVNLKGVSGVEENDTAFLRVHRLLKLGQLAGFRRFSHEEKEDISGLKPQNHAAGWVKIVFLNSNVTHPAAMFLILLYIFCSFSFCFTPNAYAQTTSTSTGKISLFAKTGSGDYYTLYPDGIEKEEAYIGGFKSVQLDPLEENIYFFDTVLKVIGKINLKDRKVSKVIGKPKSSLSQNFLQPVKFSDASLGKINDFTFDKYGNIFILYSVDSKGNPNPRILKASLKDGTIKEVLSINDSFRPTHNQYLNSDYFGFNLDSLSYDHDRFIYLTGTFTSLLEGFNVWQWDTSTATTQVVLRFDSVSNGIELHAGTKSIKDIGLFPHIILGSNNPNNFKLKGITFDHEKTCYLSYLDYVDPVWNSYTNKIVSGSNGTYTQESFIGDGTGSVNDIGDGGLAKAAYAGLNGPRCLCGDKNGDLFIADTGTNRVRKILKDNGLIATVAGGGTETLSFGQLKTPRSVSLSGPNTLLVDKSNNLYIVENGRILTINNFVSHGATPAQEV